MTRDLVEMLNAAWNLLLAHAQDCATYPLDRCPKNPQRVTRPKTYALPLVVAGPRDHADAAAAAAWVCSPHAAAAHAHTRAPGPRAPHARAPHARAPKVLI